MFPWAEIKTRYETGKYSMNELAEEYGFSPHYGRKKSSQEGWDKTKGYDKVVEEHAKKKTLELEGLTEAALRQSYGKLMRAIRLELVKELFGDDTDFNRLKQLKISTQILENCRDIEWDVYGVKKAAKHVKQEITGEDGGPITIAELAKSVEEWDQTEEYNKAKEKYDG